LTELSPAPLVIALDAHTSTERSEIDLNLQVKKNPQIMRRGLHCQATVM